MPFAVFGIAVTVLFGVVCLVGVLKGFPHIAMVIFAFFFLLGLFCTLKGLVWRIEYDTEQITVRSCFGIRRRFSYQHLTACSGGKKDKKLYFGRRKICLDELCVGEDAFFHFAQNRYRILHAGNALPVHRDVFGEKVENPGEFVFIFILIYLVCAIFPIIVYQSFTPTYIESQLHWGEITITRASWSDDVLILYDEYDYPYEIPDARNNVADLDALLREIPGNARLVSSERNEKDDAQLSVFQIGSRLNYDHRNVYVLSNAETQTTYVTLAQMNRYYTKQNFCYLGLSFIPAVVWTLFILAFFYVVHHASQLPKSVVRLFIKDGYLIEQDQTRVKRKKKKKR